MKQLLVKENLPYYLLPLTVIFFLVIGSFYDLQISLDLYTGANPFTAFFEAFGWLIGYLFVPLAGMLLYFNRLKNNRLNQLVKVLGLAFTFIGMTLLFINALGLVEKVYKEKLIFDKIFVSVLISGWLTFIIIHFLKGLFRKYYKELIAILIINVILYFTYFVFVEFGLKLIVNRTRFEDIIVSSPLEGFTSWYQRGLGGKSFPSGHTALAAISLFFVFIPDFFPTKIKRVTFFSLSMLYTFIMAYARIALGKHFVSDVTFSILIQLIAVFTIYRTPLYKFLLKTFASKKDYIS